MRQQDQDWMDYIEGEVRATCEAKGWGHQIRRKGPARSKFVTHSPIEDYEWKLIPGARGRLPDVKSTGFDDGDYYVLSCDRENGRFLFQHDTCHVGVMGPRWQEETYTQIHMGVSGIPPVEWLHEHLLSLTARFRPNSFSVT